MNEHSDRTDPDGIYGAEGLTQAERTALTIIRLFPEAQVSRTRDVIQLELGGEAGCVVLVTREAVDIRLPTVEWTQGAYGPRATSRAWKRVSTPRLSDVRLIALIEAAMEKRRSEHANCSFCGQSFPPEHMTGDACHGCASTHRGVVY